MDWQPIETAPKDGTHVLVTKAGWSTMAVASFEYGEWSDMGDIGWGGYCDVEPTHWMPLPEPPAITAGARRAETSSGSGR